MERKKIQKKIQIFAIFFCCPFSPVFSLFGHNFCSHALIEKEIIFPRSLSVFLSSKKVSENKDKNSAYGYLPEISFVPQRVNGPFGVKGFSRFLTNHVNISLLICLFGPRFSKKNNLHHIYIYTILVPNTEGFLFLFFLKHTEGFFNSPRG